MKEVGRSMIGRIVIGNMTMKLKEVAVTVVRIKQGNEEKEEATVRSEKDQIEKETTKMIIVTGGDGVIKNITVTTTKRINIITEKTTTVEMRVIVIMKKILDILEDIICTEDSIMIRMLITININNISSSYAEPIHNHMQNGTGNITAKCKGML